MTVEEVIARREKAGVLFREGDWPAVVVLLDRGKFGTSDSGDPSSPFTTEGAPWFYHWMGGSWCATFWGNTQTWEDREADGENGRELYVRASLVPREILEQLIKT